MNKFFKKSLCICFATAIFYTVFTGFADGGENFIINSGFQDGITGWTTTGGTTVVEDTSGGLIIPVDSSLSGNKIARTLRSGGTIKQNIAVNKGDTYKIQYLLNSDGGTFYKISQTDFSTTQTNIVSTAKEWIEYNAFYTEKDDTNIRSFTLQCNYGTSSDSTTSAVMWDDVTIRQVDLTEPVFNSSFEKGFSDWARFNIPTKFLVESDKSNIYLGDKALKITADGTTETLTQAVAVEANLQYYLEFWAKGDGAAKVSVENSNTVLAETAVTASGEWTLYRAALNSGANTALNVKISSHNTGICYLDNIKVVTSEKVKPELIVNQKEKEFIDVSDYILSGTSSFTTDIEIRITNETTQTASNIIYASADNGIFEQALSLEEGVNRIDITAKNTYIDNITTKTVYVVYLNEPRNESIILNYQFNYNLELWSCSEAGVESASENGNVFVKLQSTSAELYQETEVEPYNYYQLTTLVKTQGSDAEIEITDPQSGEIICSFPIEGTDNNWQDKTVTFYSGGKNNICVKYKGSVSGVFLDNVRLVSNTLPYIIQLINNSTAATVLNNINSNADILKSTAIGMDLGYYNSFVNDSTRQLACERILNKNYTAAGINNLVQDFYEGVILAYFQEQVKEAACGITAGQILSSYQDSYFELPQPAKTDYYNMLDGTSELENQYAAKMNEALFKYQPYSSFNEFKTVFEREIGLQMINSASYSEVTELLIKYKSPLQILSHVYFADSLTAEQKQSANIELCKNDYATISELKAALDKATSFTPYTPVNSSKTSGGGGGASYSVSVPVLAVEEKSKETQIEPFTDLEGYEWALESINSLREKKIVEGSDGKFRPDNLVTREEFIKMLIYSFGLLNENAVATFYDVDENEWYYKSVASAQEKGITNGIDGESFGVGLPITRQDMATIAFRVSKFCNTHFEITVEKINFDDEADISDYAREAVDILQCAGVVNGSGSGFAPLENATRAQAAKIIFELIRNIPQS